MSLGDGNIPIIGQAKVVCFKCLSPVRQAPNGVGVVCMTENCARFGLISIIAKDVNQQGGTENDGDETKSE